MARKDANKAAALGAEEETSAPQESTREELGGTSLTEIQSKLFEWQSMLMKAAENRWEQRENKREERHIQEMAHLKESIKQEASESATQIRAALEEGMQKLCQEAGMTADNLGTRFDVRTDLLAADMKRLAASVESHTGGHVELVTSGPADKKATFFAAKTAGDKDSGGSSAGSRFDSTSKGNAVAEEAPRSAEKGSLPAGIIKIPEGVYIPKTSAGGHAVAFPSMGDRQKYSDMVRQSHYLSNKHRPSQPVYVPPAMRGPDSGSSGSRCNQDYVDQPVFGNRLEAEDFHGAAEEGWSNPRIPIRTDPEYTRSVAHRDGAYVPISSIGKSYWRW